MKLKLDENLGPSIASRLQQAGHDVRLTREQGLGGREEKRDIRGKLWIVARGKIREYWDEDDG